MKSLCLALLLGASATTQAVNTGWNKTGGIYLYADAGNWVGGNVNNVFDSSLTLTSRLYLDLVNNFRTSGDLIFDYHYESNFGVALSFSTAPGTLTLGGNLKFTPHGSSSFSESILSIGDQHITNIDLGGGVRTIETGAGGTIRTDHNSTILNGSLIKTGLGAFVLSGISNISAIEVRGGTLAADSAQSLGSGPITFSGASQFQCDSSSGSIGNLFNFNANVTFDGLRGFSHSGPVRLGTGPRTFVLNYSGADTACFSGSISGDATAKIIVTSTPGSYGTLALAGNNTFAGGVLVTNGTLGIGHKNALGSGALELGQGAQLVFSPLNSDAPELTGVNAVANPYSITGDLTVGNASTVPIELSAPSNLGSAIRKITIFSETLILSGIISGGPGSGIMIDGSGTLSLTNANTFGGGITVNGGRLMLGNRLAAGPGTLTFGGGTFQFNYLGTAAVPNPIALRGDVQILTNFSGSEFSGALTLVSGLGKLTVQGDLVLSGVINGAAGAPLQLGGGGSIFLKYANAYSGGTVMEPTSPFSSGTTIRLGTSGSLGTGPLSIAGNTILIADVALTGAQAVANPLLIGAKLSAGGPLAFELSGTVDLTNGNRVIVSASSGFLLSGVIKSGGLIFDANYASGTRLTGLNTYSGPTEIRTGTLWIGRNAPSGAPGALGNATSPILINMNAGLLISGPFTVGRDLNILANAGSGSSSLLGGDTANSSFFTGNINLGRMAALNAASGGIVEFSGIISSAASAGIGKVGGGKVILTGANTYLGRTFLLEGVLLVNNTAGSGTGSGGVTVLAGELGGTGTISGDVTIGNANGRADAFLSPGQGIGTFTTGGLTLLSDGVFKFEFNSTLQASDRLIANGAVALGDASLIASDLGSGFLPQGFAFVLLENRSASSTTGKFFSFPEYIPFHLGANDFYLDYHAALNADNISNDVVLRSANVPEPAALALLVPGAAWLAAARRRTRVPV